MRCGDKPERLPDQGQEAILQLALLRGMGERHPEESNRRLRIDWSELPALYAAGIPLAELM